MTSKGKLQFGNCNKQQGMENWQSAIGNKQFALGNKEKRIGFKLQRGMKLTLASESKTINYKLKTFHVGSI